MSSQGIKRRAFLAGGGALIGTLSLAGCSESTRSVGRRDDEAADEWPTLGQNTQNTKFNPGGAGPKSEPTVEWTYEGSNILTPPLVAGNSIVLSGIETLAALELDGTQRWERTYRGVFDELNEFTSIATVTEDIVCGTIRRQDRSFELVGFSHSGDRRWSINLGGPSVGATPFVMAVDGTIYTTIGVEFDEIVSPAVLAVDSLNGEILWSDSFENIRTYPMMTEQLVVVHSGDENLYAYDRETGDVRWQFNTQDASISRPVAFDETIYVQYGNEMVGLAADDGTVSVESMDQFGGDFAIVDGVVVESVGDTLRAFDIQRSELLWENGYSNTLNPPAIADGIVYVGGEDERMRAIDILSGEEQWSRSFSGETMRPIVAQGKVLTVSDDTLFSLV
jgi:outer membrane protein assembly factor BamB